MVKANFWFYLWRFLMRQQHIRLVSITACSETFFDKIAIARFSPLRSYCFGVYHIIFSMCIRALALRISFHPLLSFAWGQCCSLNTLIWKNQTWSPAHNGEVLEMSLHTNSCLFPLWPACDCSRQYCERLCWTSACNDAPSLATFAWNPNF